MPFVCSAVIIICVIYFVYRRFKKRTDSSDSKDYAEVPNEEPLLSSV